MPPELPPMTFRLPAGWTPVDVPAAAAPDVDFVALHTTTDDGFTANITVSARTYGATSLEEIADRAVTRLRAEERDVVVRRRQALASGATSGLGQEVTFTTLVLDRPVPITQVQILLGTGDSPDTGGQAVQIVTLTATTRTAPPLIADLRDMVESARPD